MQYGFRISPIVSIFLSLAWISVCLSFVFAQGGMAMLAAASTSELAMLLAGACLPLILIKSYTGLATKTGNAAQDRQYQDLVDRIEALNKVKILPESTQAHIQAITQAFEGETKLLHGVSDEMLNKFSDMTAQLDRQRSDMQHFSEQLQQENEHASSLMSKQADALAANSHVIADLVDLIDNSTERTKSEMTVMIEKLKAPLEALKGDIQSSIQEFSDMIAAVHSEQQDLRNNLQHTKSVSMQTGAQIEAQFTALGERAQNTKKSVDQLEMALETHLSQIDNLAEQAQARGNAIMGWIEQNSQSIEDSSEKLISQAQVLGETVAESGVYLQDLNANMNAYSSKIGRDIQAHNKELMNLSESLPLRLDEASQQASETLQKLYDTHMDVNGRLTRELSVRMDKVADQLDASFEWLGAKGEELEKSIIHAGERVNESILAQNEELSVKIDQGLMRMAEQGQKLSLDLGNATAEFNQDFWNKVQDLSKQRAILAEQIEQLGEESSLVLDRYFSRAIEGMEQRVAIAGERLSGYADRASDNFEVRLDFMLNRLDDSGNRMVEQVQGLEREIIDLAQSANSEITSLMQGFGEKMGHETNDLIQRLLRMGEQVPSAVERMGENAQEAIEKLEQLNERSGLSRHNIRAMLTDFDEAADDFSQRMSAIYDSAKIQLEKGKGNFEALTTATQSEQDKLEVQLNSLENLAERFKTAGLNLTNSMNERLDMVAQAGDNAQMLAEQCERRLLNVSETTQDSLQRCQQQVVMMSKDTEDDLLRLDELSNATLQRLQGFNDHIHAMQHSLKDMAQLADEQSQRIAQSSDNASARAEQLITSLNDSQKAAFLRTASDVVAQLQELAINVDEIMQGELPEQVTRAIRSGDRGISLRRLGGFAQNGTTSEEAKVLAHHYHNHQHFQGLIEQYMRACEGLIKLALEADSTRLMHSTVLSSDIGKLYIFLRECLGNKRAQKNVAA